MSTCYIQIVLIFVTIKFMMLVSIFQNVTVVTMALIVKIIVGYALIVLVKDMMDCVHMDVLKG